MECLFDAYEIEYGYNEKMNLNILNMLYFCTSEHLTRLFYMHLISFYYLSIIIL